MAADPVDGAAEEYFDALLHVDEGRAVDVALALLDGGSPGEDVLLRLVAPALMRVGTLWQSGAWSVAQEHAATAIAERVVFAVAARTRRRESRGRIVVGCLDGERHALAARIVGEVLRMHDWTVTFLGASVPTPHLVSFLHHHGPEAVALSAAVSVHLPAAHRAIVAAQRTGTPVLVGGAGFGPDGRWARCLGADAWAPTPAAAVALLDRRPSWPGVESGPSAPPGSASGSEYLYVRQRRGRLVVAALQRLRACAGRSGVVAVLSDSPVDDDLGQVADVLAAAAYVDDRRLFTDHLGWLAAVALARGTGSVLPEVLAAFRPELHDLPFARACLADAAALLTGQGRP